MDNFNLNIQQADSLQEAADTAILECLKVKKGEKVLIVTNPHHDVLVISQALYNSSLKAEANPSIVIQPVKTQLDASEDTVIGAISSQPDVVISMSHQKIGKDLKAQKDPYIVNGQKIDSIFHFLLETNKTRGFWSPTVTIEQFIKTVAVDYSRMKKEAAYIKKILDDGTRVKITCPSGTDIEFGINKRDAFVDDGDFSEPGAGGNLPAGESFISPEIGTANGTIAFKGSISVYNGVLILDDPLLVTVRSGFVDKIADDENGKILADTIERGKKTAEEYGRNGKLSPEDSAEYAKNTRSLGELGIGINPKAEIIGNMLIDEKVYKTCHIAIGSNYDNDASSLIHLDGLIQGPAITVMNSEGEWIEVFRDGDLISF